MLSSSRYSLTSETTEKMDVSSSNNLAIELIPSDTSLICSRKIKGPTTIHRNY